MIEAARRMERIALPFDHAHEAHLAVGRPGFGQPDAVVVGCVLDAEQQIRLAAVDHVGLENDVILPQPVDELLAQDDLPAGPFFPPCALPRRQCADTSTHRAAVQRS